MITSPPREETKPERAGDEMKEKIKFTGRASFLGTGEGEFFQENGNREWIAECGCKMTSGARAYGTSGSAYQIEECEQHQPISPPP